jgi:hypothetical protein
MPADVYYGDMNGTWMDDLNFVVDPVVYPDRQNVDDDGKFDHELLVGDLKPELAVGRIDMRDMTLATYGGSYPLNEQELIRRYLNRDHFFRHGVVQPTQPGIIQIYWGHSGAKRGFANLAPLVGAGNIDIANVVPQTESWFEKTDTEFYLWGYGEGPGLDYRTLAGLGTTQSYLQDNSSVAFNFFYGSYVVDWDRPDSFLRAPLAGQGIGLTSLWGNADFYPMGLGDSIGESLVFHQSGGPGVITINSGQVVVQQGVADTHTALMGDPTLRMHVVRPPSGVNAARNGSLVTVNWTASPDPSVLGYNVYRRLSDGSFMKLNGPLVTGTSFIDTTAGAGPQRYMVRAVKLQQGASGSYHNASQGVFYNLP